jgi:hypothetical protein
MDDGVDPATQIDIVWHESLGVLVFFVHLSALAVGCGSSGDAKNHHIKVDASGEHYHAHRSLGSYPGSSHICAPRGLDFCACMASSLMPLFFSS